MDFRFRLHRRISAISKDTKRFENRIKREAGIMVQIKTNTNHPRIAHCMPSKVIFLRKRIAKNIKKFICYSISRRLVEKFIMVPNYINKLH